MEEGESSSVESTEQKAAAGYHHCESTHSPGK